MEEVDVHVGVLEWRGEVSGNVVEEGDMLYLYSNI